MNQYIARVTLLVEDYDQAIEFYTNRLNFKLLEDTQLPDGKRWVVVAPPSQSHNNQTALLLAKASSQKQLAAVGNQTGGRVGLFLYTDDFWRDYQAMQKNKIDFVREPKEEPYGTVAVFQDLHGNLWDLIQPAA